MKFGLDFAYKFCLRAVLTKTFTALTTPSIPAERDYYFSLRKAYKTKTTIETPLITTKVQNMPG